jgi:hypothetical protein
MLRQARLRAFIACAFVLGLTLSFPALAAKDKTKKKQALPKGTPVLWRAPDDIATRDLFLGPGGAEMQPRLSRLKFIKEEKGGYSKKFRVRDAAGREWVAKIGKEAQSETAAVRLMWAVGYETEINYLVPRVTIPGKGTFENVRFEARPKEIKRLEEWKWDKNPFVGTRPFQGMKVMMALLNNWDIKDSNNEILLVRGARGNELQYIISDLGATFGKSGSLPVIWRFTRSRSNPEDYAKAKFLDEVNNGYVFFHYNGKRNDLFDDITVADARWIGHWLARLSQAQIRDAFSAANYSREEIDLLTEAVRNRIEELRTLSEAEPR